MQQSRVSFGNACIAHGTAAKHLLYGTKTGQQSSPQHNGCRALLPQVVFLFYPWLFAVGGIAVQGGDIH